MKIDTGTEKPSFAALGNLFNDIDDIKAPNTLACRAGNLADLRNNAVEEADWESDIYLPYLFRLQMSTISSAERGPCGLETNHALIDNLQLEEARYSPIAIPFGKGRAEEKSLSACS